FIAVILATTVVVLALPYFNNLVGKELTLRLDHLSSWLFLGGLTICVGLFSGLYPAILMPAFKAIYALKGVVKHSFSAVAFRKGLVVFQFAISMMLISGTWLVFEQVDYILNKDIGFNKENLIMVPMQGRDELAGNFKAFREELASVPQVIGVTGATGGLIDYGRSTGSANWEGKDPSINAEIGIVLVNDNFIDVMEMDLMKGRSLSGDFGADSMNYIVNEVAAKLMGFDDPVDKRLSVWGINGRIVGLVKDFHHQDMYEPIGPMIMMYEPRDSRMAMVRIQGDMKPALAAIEEINAKLYPGVPFRFELMSETYKDQYEGELVVSELANIFSIIAVFISCLGLFALSAFSADQRSKEIGVRKVHGASVGQIILMLSKDYSKLMLLAIVLAIPITWFYVGDWLDTFKYHTFIKPTVFIVSGLIAFAIGTITVSFKSLQAAIMNPVDSLKEE
ncbi:MAG: FtsX-like permease family protein, partial [Bacteroidota bacterium]